MNIQPRLLKLGLNTTGRDFVIGDIHGCVQAMQRQLNRLGFDYHADRLICVGDLIDRGPDSHHAFALLDEDWFFSVIGNHEHLFVSGMEEHHPEHREVFLSNGGEWVLDYREQWPEWFRRIRELPLGIELENRHGERIGVIHADYPRPHWQDFSHMSWHDAERAIWAREAFRYRHDHRVAGIDWLIYGHNVTGHELRLGNRIYIDAGAYLGRDFIIKDINNL